MFQESGSKKKHPHKISLFAREREREMVARDPRVKFMIQFLFNAKINSEQSFRLKKKVIIIITKNK